MLIKYTSFTQASR